ncbi:MAG: methyltransferase domain-containing protein [Ktedonobacterales bacterium]
MAQANDQAYLRNEQYRDASNLNARIALHANYSVNPANWQRWVFDHLLAALGTTEPRAVLEIGCGPAQLWVENTDRIPSVWDVTLADFSDGMIAAARDHLAAADHAFTYQVADVQELPFADASFDAVIANHMLYHVPDRPRALAQIRRVLRPGGALFAATNGVDHLKELDALFTQFVPQVGGRVRFSEAFTLENGEAQLRQVFPAVTLDTYEDGLVVTDVEPLMAYIRSMGDVRLLTDDLQRELKGYLTQQIASHGAFRITKSTGLFVAR